MAGWLTVVDADVVLPMAPYDDVAAGDIDDAADDDDTNNGETCFLRFSPTPLALGFEVSIVVVVSVVVAVVGVVVVVVAVVVVVVVTNRNQFSSQI